MKVDPVPLREYGVKREPAEGAPRRRRSSGAGGWVTCRRKSSKGGMCAPAAHRRRRTRWGVTRPATSPDPPLRRTPPQRRQREGNPDPPELRHALEQGGSRRRRKQRWDREVSVPSQLVVVRLLIHGCILLLSIFRSLFWISDCSQIMPKIVCSCCRAFYGKVVWEHDFCAKNWWWYIRMK
jgi:hypothetical protein